MMKHSEHKLRMTPGTYYVWCGGSCDYGREERCSGGAYIMQLNDDVLDTYVISDDHTTEFRMILTVMTHAMTVIPENSVIVFLTNVSYIQQNYDKEPTGSSANSDLIRECIASKNRHASVSVKIVPFHKYHEMHETHDMAHKAMLIHRNTLGQTP